MLLQELWLTQVAVCIDLYESSDVTVGVDRIDLLNGTITHLIPL